MKILCGILVPSLLCFLGAGLPNLAVAQTPNGTISGDVVDQSRAVVPNALITVINVATGVKSKTQTNTVGAYTVPFLVVGPYEVSIEAAGFAKELRRGLTLQVGQDMRLDFSLTVGSINQSIEVVGSVPQIETETSSKAEVIGATQIQNLPINGRNYLLLALLAPGMVTSPKAAYGWLTQGSLSASGQRPEQNNFQLDGIDNKETSYNQPAVDVAVDAIGEFRTIVGMAPAEYGRGGGAVIIASLKSGSNSIHGAGFEFFRNEALDARNYFASSTTVLRRNEFGGSIGGPIVKNKTFFFGSYDGTRLFTPVGVPSYVVPTDDLRAGIFSGPIIDPTTGDPFPGNTIPAGRIDPISAKIQQFFPEPNNPSVPSSNFIFNHQPASHQRTDDVATRVDEQLTSRDLINFRYLFNQINNPGSPAWPSGIGDLTQHVRAQLWGLEHTHTFGPHLFNDFHASWTRRNNVGQDANANKTDYASQLGLIGTEPAGQFWRFPATAITGFGSLSGAALDVIVTDTIQIQDQIAMQLGRHNIRTGADVRRLRARNLDSPSSAGYTFTGQFTGNPYADFLLGIPATASRSLAEPNRDSRQTYISMFFQDDWNVRPNLTLNLGIRWEEETPITVLGDIWAGIDLSTGTLLLPKSTEPIAGPFYANIKTDTPVRFIDTHTPYDPDHRAFAPRFGFAYTPFGWKNTVVRGGFGLFYVAPPWQSFSISEVAPFTERPTYTSDPLVPTLGYNQGVSGVGSLATAPFTIFPFGSRHIALGYVEQWLLDIQHQFPKDLLLDVSYTGSHGVHQPRLTNRDVAAPGPGPIQPRLPFPQFARVQDLETDGISSYQGMTIKGEKRSKGGSGFGVFYTYSKAIDDATSTNLVLQITDPNPARRRVSEIGLSDIDMRHNITGNYTFVLPFGPGQRFLSQVKGPGAFLLGGWQVSGIVTHYCCAPLTPSVSRTLVNAGIIQARPNRIANGNLPDGQRTLARYFDTSAFPVQARFTIGTAGRNIIYAPGENLWDLAVTKSVKVTESQRIEFRGEFFNALNHPNFGFPGLNAQAPTTFGVISSALSPRTGELALRYYF